jgi:membrane protease YdiL (CAAX protease family)
VADLGGLIYGASTSMANVLDEFVNGFFEELIVRGYLMTEIKRLTGSIFFAVLCSVGVQISYHFYQGGPLAISHIGTFMLFAVFYAKTNRILPPILAHSAIDLNSFLNYALRNT